MTNTNTVDASNQAAEPVLTAEKVHALLMSVFLTEEEAVPVRKMWEEQHVLPDDVVLAEGVRIKCVFNKQRVEEVKGQVRELLLELPFEKGGSFLEMCTDKHGRLWGEHTNMDELVVLGMATKQMALSPRKLALSHGVPWVHLLLDDAQ